MKPKIKNPVQQVKPPSTQATTLPIEETCHNCSTHEGTTSHATVSVKVFKTSVAIMHELKSYLSLTLK